MIPSHTLSRFIRGEERKHWSATGELSDLISAIALGVKIISSLVATAGFKGLQGYTGRTNVQGERTQKLDEEADKILTELLATSGHFGLLVSEEQEEVLTTPPGFEDGKYVVAFDPMDGSSNLNLNIPVGTIFTVFKKRALNRPATIEDFLQPGSSIVAAGYAVYGSKTTFVYSAGDGVHGFTLDPAIGEFMLTDENISCPTKGTTYSINEGNAGRWDLGVKRFIDLLKSDQKKLGTPYSSRYVGSMVADVDRVLRQGGIFMYPADSANKNGKLRLLYECLPIAFIIEQAGGAAINGEDSILEIAPESIHARSPLIVGSLESVNWYQREVHGSVRTLIPGPKRGGKGRSKKKK